MRVPRGEGRPLYDLYWIAVDPTRQGAGIGQRLLAACERNVRERGGRLLLQLGDLEEQPWTGAAGIALGLPVRRSQMLRVNGEMRRRGGGRQRSAATFASRGLETLTNR